MQTAQTPVKLQEMTKSDILAGETFETAGLLKAVAAHLHWHGELPSGNKNQKRGLPTRTRFERTL